MRRSRNGQRSSSSTVAVFSSSGHSLRLATHEVDQCLMYAFLEVAMCIRVDSDATSFLTGLWNPCELFANARQADRRRAHSISAAAPPS